MPLEVQVQGDFSGGMYRGGPSRELIPPNGAYTIYNGLLEEDGSIVRRGGSTLKATASNNIDLLWDGYLQAGTRTVFADTVIGYTSLCVLNGDDTTNTSFGLGVGVNLRRPAAGNGLLAVPYADTNIAIYAGARTAGPVGASTSTVAAGSTTVTGSGTSWTTTVVPGHVVMTSGTFIYVGVVASVESNTSLTLNAPAPAAYSAASFQFLPVGSLTTAPGVSSVATVGNPARLCYSTGGRIYFSAAGNFGLFDPTDYHQIPQGGQVLGMESLRNILFVFTTSGVFTISNMDFNLTDAQGNVQHRMEQINRDLVLWDQRGIAGSRGALVVPGVDDVYLVSDAAAPQVISKPISTLYRSYVAAGFQCGGAAVFRDHYFLPIMNGTSNVATFVCKLNGGAWTQWLGDAASSSWFAVRGSSGAARAPQLFSAYNTRIQNLTGCFTPTAANKRDADGTAHSFEVVSRDYTTSGLRKNLVKKVRLGYELTDAASDNPTMTMSYATAEDNAFATLTGTAAEAVGQASQMFPVNTARSRFVRFKIESLSPASRMAVKSLELFTRAGGRQ